MKQGATFDKARASYYRHISGKRWGNVRNYELVIDSSVGVEKSVETVLDYVSSMTGADEPTIDVFACGRDQSVQEE